MDDHEGAPEGQKGNRSLTAVTADSDKSDFPTEV
jgi:hypothetical protein